MGGLISRLLLLLGLVARCSASSGDEDSTGTNTYSFHGISSGTNTDNFGSCTFEEGMCGWNDTSGSMYQWRREMANVSTSPGYDHTTETPAGHVMHIDADHSDLYANAILERHLPGTPALACQISFWYHMEDDGGSKSELRLKAVTNGSTTQLLRIRWGTKRAWENATALIGNRAQGTKLEFVVSPSIGKQDVMLDDILFSYCHDDDLTPPGFDSLSCDFESDTCSWFPDYSATALWKRAKEPLNYNPAPESDHTTGSGYFLFIGTNRDSEPSMTARVISYPQTSLCVSFWYHIYGSSIGSLRFITRRPGGEEEVWMRSGTQGNKWRFADLTFPAGEMPLQFIFEAVLGGTEGSIAIDDVLVSNGLAGSCPAERECTFQGSLCGLQRDPTADFTWVRVAAAQLPPHSPGPGVDHTLNTPQGYYLSAGLWNQTMGSKGRMETSVRNTTSTGGDCWMFWYHMEGEKVGELRVFLKQTHSTNSGPSSGPNTTSSTSSNTSDLGLQLLWERTGDQGGLWRHGRATVLSPATPYQVVFEATVGDARGDIAIDDMLVLDGACPSEGFCDFEIDLCGWLNPPHNSSVVDWDWTTGSKAEQFCPDLDHTTNSAKGHYLVLPLDYFQVKQAFLESEHMDPVASGCLEFWWHMDSWSTADAVQTVVYINESDGLRPMWNESGRQGNVWQKIMVDYTSSSRHQIVFMGRSEKDSGCIALDDVFIRPNVRCIDLIPTTVAPTTPPTTPSPTALDCTFEEGVCEWQQDTEDDSDWLLQRGVQTNGVWQGPVYDHTLGNNKGVYLVVNMSRDEGPRVATLSASLAGQPQEVCVGLWFYMSGPAGGALEVKVQTAANTSIVWRREGTQTANWLHAQVTVNLASMKRVLVSARSGIDGHGFIAIDDVKVRGGACPETDHCGFESASLCGFEAEEGGANQWSPVIGREGWVDHTYGTQLGHYMAVSSVDLHSPASARLLAPERSSSPGMCLRFWHLLSAGRDDSLSVHVEEEGELSPALWSLSGRGPSTGWEVSEVTVSSAFKFRVVFSANLNPGNNSRIHLDDVSLTSGACVSTGSCDFESGFCTWRNKPGAAAAAGDGTPSGHQWVHADGHFGGPLTDHTTSTPYGRFLLSKTTGISSKAQLLSQWLPPDTDTCFSLHYLMAESGSATLRVLVRSLDEQEEELLLDVTHSETTWTRMSGSIRRHSHFQVVIEAESGGEGFVAIDDALFTPGLCTDNVTVSDFTGCHFESGTCGWQDISVGQFKWEHGRNGTPTANTGPSTDNTLGTELGWYMAVEADNGLLNSYAHMQSPNLEQANAECTLHFYYHMFGQGIGELQVLHQRGSTVTPLLWLSGDHGDKWQRAEVNVARTTQVFHLLFQATRTFSVLGDIAIDDISFHNCTLPDATPCPSGLFTCANRVCVEAGRVCDFTDDCGDRSDEMECELKGYGNSCSFEQGLCSWESAAAGPHGPKWTRTSGALAWPHHGPPRDHTRNLAHGHFIVPGYPLSPGQTSEVLSATLLPSSQCYVRFYVYWQEAAANDGLTVRLRTERSGVADEVLWRGGDGGGRRVVGWRRMEASFSSPYKTKIVFQYSESGRTTRVQVAVDDISFSPECKHDPNNSHLPDETPTPPPTPVPTTPPPCGEHEFHCWRSEGRKCVPADAQCDYRLDCPLGEDEENCGPCSFESGKCEWKDVGESFLQWYRQQATDHTYPPLDHTIGSGGYYMSVGHSLAPVGFKAKLQSPPLPDSSPYCQMRFHFHMSGGRPGNLTVWLYDVKGQRSLLWTRVNNATRLWSPEHVPLGKQLRNYTVVFSSEVLESQDLPVSNKDIVALDDISFHNCHTSFQPPDVTAMGCTFSQDLCSWVQGAADDLDWERRSGPTDTPNTGPAGDHTSSQGYYVYLESSKPSKVGDVAQLNSPLLPPAGQNGYCLTVWYHMFGATVGSLKVFIKSIESRTKTLVWERRQTQGDQWRMLRHHVVVDEVHQVVLEASVGGEAGDIALDDIILSPGACPLSDLCDFEEDDCGWTQLSEDDFNWSYHSGKTPTAHTGPSVDHSTNTHTGHYYYLEASGRRPGRFAKMASPAIPTGKGRCVQFWYHMWGEGMGTMNVYQQSTEGVGTMIFTRVGNMGNMWRLAQAPLHDTQGADYKIVVEGVVGSSELGDMAVDDLVVVDTPCPEEHRCDFELNTCGWTNLEGVDDTDWIRGQGLNPNPNTGPGVDHTTNSSIGYYMYVDSSVGLWGDTAMLFSDVVLPTRGGHCLTFWYHMSGQNVGTLSLMTTDKPSAGEDDPGLILWTLPGHQGSLWFEDSVFVESDKPSWFVFMYQKGRTSGGDVALDDIHLSPGPCLTVTPTRPPATHDLVAIAVGVIISVVVIGSAIALLYKLRKRRNGHDDPILEHDTLDQASDGDHINFQPVDLQARGNMTFNNSFDSQGDTSEDTGNLSIA